MDAVRERTKILELPYNRLTVLVPEPAPSNQFIQRTYRRHQESDRAGAVAPERGSHDRRDRQNQRLAESLDSGIYQRNDHEEDGAEGRFREEAACSRRAVYSSSHDWPRVGDDRKLHGELNVGVAHLLASGSVPD